VVGLWELTSRLAERKGIRAPLVPLAAGGAAMVVSGYVSARTAPGAMALTALAVLVWRMAEPPENYLRDVTAVSSRPSTCLSRHLCRDDARREDGPRRVWSSCC